MRSIKKEHIIQKVVEETIYLTGEEITVINEYKELGTISIVVSYKTSDGITISKDEDYMTRQDVNDLTLQNLLNLFLVIC